jgi:L-aminopeptidase/D-esterase-like protein
LQSGPRNLISDVTGLRVGNAEDARLASGVTVLLPDEPATAAASVLGGGPGTRELDAIGLEGTVGVVHALVLSGGSAFGLDAATGVQNFLREKGIGFAVGDARIPIVPAAILFDMLNGGDKEWGRKPPYQDMAYEAASGAAANFRLGSSGAGYGASVAWKADGARLRGGLGSASCRDGDITIGALVAVNAAGAVTFGDGPHFLAAPFEMNGEFGNLGLPSPLQPPSPPILKFALSQSTTLAVVATDATLSRAQCKRLAMMAQAGLARAIAPVFSPLDGDIVFALATGRQPLLDPHFALARLGALAADTLARAIARAVYEAQGALPDGTASWRDAFGAP